MTVSAPGDPVLLGSGVAAEVREAVRAALHNVGLHAGVAAHAWVLLEALDGEVRITVRDDGVGLAAGRAEAAADEGRIGLARSIRGRIADWAAGAP